MPLLEKALIERIRRRAGSGPGIVRGIGDDSAVIRVPRGHDALVTTDCSLEGVHFRKEWHPPDSVGHRCLARGLSDIAAMGGKPIAAFLSLAAPPGLPQSWMDGFLAGFLRLAKQFEVTLAGGDTAQSPAGIFADIVVLGSVPRGKAILRSGAQPGDLIYVTGELGGSAAVLRELRERGRGITPARFPQHYYPVPRLVVGRFLLEQKLASAMIDLSDGLSTDLAHICEESRVGAEIEAAALPLAKLRKMPVDLQFALHGGEDYELLFTAPQRLHVPGSIEGVRISRIGRMVRGRGVKITSGGRVHRLLPQGWQHFSHES